MHTQGKWEVSSSFLVVTNKAEIIANTQPTGLGDLDVSMDECLANAKLIAAAPDLLEACKELVSTFNPDNQAIYEFAREQIEDASAAIAKAEK